MGLKRGSWPTWLWRPASSWRWRPGAGNPGVPTGGRTTPTAACPWQVRQVAQLLPDRELGVGLLAVSEMSDCDRVTWRSLWGARLRWRVELARPALGRPAGNGEPGGVRGSSRRRPDGSGRGGRPASASIVTRQPGTVSGLVTAQLVLDEVSNRLGTGAATAEADVPTAPGSRPMRYSAH